MIDSELLVSARKSQLRSEIKKIKISAAIRRRRSLKLCSQIEKSSFFKHSQTIGLYSALADEIDVSRIAQKALDLKKNVFFPKVSGSQMSFYEVFDLKADLKSGKFGILEPVLSRSKKRIRPLDLVLIPGRAFDKKGKRLGRGVGFYDRLLEKWSDSVRMGVAFSEQIVKCVPSEAHDVEMDIVLTA